MEGIEINMTMIVTCVLMGVRVTSLLFALPFFGDSVVSPQVRILLGVALTLGLYPLLPDNWLVLGQPADGEWIAGGGFGILVLALGEVVIGLILGYLARLIFEGLVMAASLVGYQMGFGTASLLMPGSDAQLNAFTALHRMVVLLVFLSLSLHYIFIHALVETFRLLPAGGGTLHALAGERILRLTALMFTTALQLAAPILVALLFTMAGLGVVARTVPQLNVFTLSFPFSFFVGLVIYAAMTPFLPAWLQKYYYDHANALLHAIGDMSP